jgi:hypothetical protein
MTKTVRMRVAIAPRTLWLVKRVAYVVFAVACSARSAARLRRPCPKRLVQRSPRRPRPIGVNVRMSGDKLWKLCLTPTSGRLHNDGPHDVFST